MISTETKLESGPAQIISWKTDYLANPDLLTGSGPSGHTWSLKRHDGTWVLGNDRAGTLAAAGKPRPLIEAAISSEAIRLAANGLSLTCLSLEGILTARTFAIAQREELLDDIRANGFDPVGEIAPCEDWMRDEFSSLQAAIVRFEAEAVDRGWRLTCGAVGENLDN